MPRIHWIVAIVPILWAPCFVEAGVHGRVYLDANGNGKLDAGEKPLAGCIVSDGCRLVRTDAGGHYELPDGAGPVTVFVVNCPHTRPSGRWWATLADGRATNAVDFGLAEEVQQEPLLFLQGTDLHVLQRPDVANFYRQYLDHVNAISLPLRFVVHTGDLVVDALPLASKNAEKLYKFYELGIARLRLPLRHVIGNHEHVGVNQPAVDIRDPDYGKAMYRRRLGPTSYAFRFGRYHFIALDCTTLNLPEHGYHDRLDDASLAWAERYLATVHQGETVILMVHQPLASGDTDRRLLKALEGKHLILTICGHGHEPTVSRWGGAPQVMGGAVSYAWHGFVPYPPDPRGYVLYRIDKEKVEYAYQDWATERSFALSSPAWEKLVSQRGMIAGTVTDFDGSLRGVTCKLADRRWQARLGREGHFADHFEANGDYSGLADGVYDLTLEATDGTRRFTHVRPLIVRNGSPQPFQISGQAILRFRVPAKQTFMGSVWLNGQMLGPASKSQQAQQEFSYTLPAAQLLRLNTITLRSGNGGALHVQGLRIEMGKNRYRDVRFPPTLPRTPAATPSKTPQQLDYYIDLAYRGPRGS
jgi:3',5'-cyclic AMP phosphodiesterase CpdA